MGRPQRNNVDYFPFICKEGNTTKYIDNTYGNDGFATWVRILRALAITDYHYLDLSNRKSLMTLCSTCKVSEETLKSLLNDLAEFGEIDADLWKQDIVWSDHFIESIEDAYAKRSNKIVKKEEFMQLLVSLRGSKPPKRESEVPVKPQSKVDYTKVDKSKEEKSKSAAPVGLQGPLENIWNEWVEYRKEIKKKLSPSTAKKQIQFLGGRADPEIIAIINQSITNGWTGLFELKENNNGRNNKQSNQAASGNFSTHQFKGTDYSAKL